ncbi:hypothetical protein DFS33DRAFT_1270109 [Desarmillaria ectypa]|nr:hypothetical protein DFS33DRAFT_1270109 [Desarmillaria ectypa]
MPCSDRESLQWEVLNGSFSASQLQQFLLVLQSSASLAPISAYLTDKLKNDPQILNAVEWTSKVALNIIGMIFSGGQTELRDALDNVTQVVIRIGVTQKQTARNIFKNQLVVAPPEKDIVNVLVPTGGIQVQASVHALAGDLLYKIMEIQRVTVELLSNFEFKLPDGVELLDAPGAMSGLPVVKGKLADGTQVPLQIAPLEI